MLKILNKMHYVLYTTIVSISMFAIIKLLYTINQSLLDISLGQNYAIELLDLIAY